jgi:hypothetical protein
MIVPLEMTELGSGRVESSYAIPIVGDNDSGYPTFLKNIQ